ncbi:MAG: phosphatidate cytidylyltransferase [Bacteroidota bacterium]|nr:phosphatidate cytidylyltransferase [Bacteroidota bacterium]
MIIFFGLSLFPVFYIIFFKQNGNTSLLKKYILYLVLAFGSIYIIEFGYALYWALVIALVGFFEVLKHLRLYNKNKLIPIIIYLLFALNFVVVNYIYLNENNLREGMLYVYALVLVFDGMSQLGGQIFGRRKLTSQLSPNKTLEGLITGIVFCYLANMAIYLQGDVVFVKFIYWIAPMLISIAALSGDLLASYYKRVCGIKDYSNLLPGHGGILDRYDGVIGASVVVWILNFAQ